MPEHDKTIVPNKSVTRINRRTVVFTACLALSCLFWILTTLSKDFTEVIKVPISYENVPSDMVVVDVLATHIDAEVKIYGFDLLWYWLKFDKLVVPINVNPKELRRVRRDGEWVHIFLTEESRNKIVSSFDEGFTVLKLSPDTLFFKYKPVYTKRVPIKLNAKIDFQKKYGSLKRPVLTPESVLVSGLKELVDTIKFISTEPVELKNLSESVSTVLKLKSVENRLVQVSASSVEVELDVVEFTEGKLSVPITVSGLKHRQLKLFPNAVEVTYLVPLALYDVIDASQFKAQVNLTGNDWKKLTRLSVELVKSPSEIRQIRIHPPQVEFIIQN
ncbi:CdaR family protein [Bacteroidota bacterium]